MPMSSVSDARVSDPDRPSVRALFVSFLMLGLTGFGGVLPLARRRLVERERWLSAEEFSDLLSFCQFLPGGNIINLSVAVGLRFRGVAGALAAIVGLIAAPTMIVLLLGTVYDRYGDDPYVRHFSAGLAAAASGLLIAVAVKIALPLRDRVEGVAVAVLGFVAISLLRLPLLPTMLILAPSSILLTWWARRRTNRGAAR